MKTRKPIRVLTFSFFLLLIAFFVTWQGGLLDRFFEPAKQPYQTIISRIPDSVKAVPLHTVQPEKEKQPEAFYTPPPPLYDDYLYMAASSKTMILPSSKFMQLDLPKSFLESQVKSLFEPDSVPAKIKAKR